MARKIFLKGKKVGARITDTDTLRTWKAEAKLIVASQLTEIPAWVLEHVNNKGTLFFEVFWCGDHWYKNGKPRRRDIDNRVKFLQDVLFSALGIDDSLIFKVNLVKVSSIDQKTEYMDSKNETCLCRLSPLVDLPKLQLS